MPVKGCQCYGGNTPELEYFCPCRDIGDRLHWRRCWAVSRPYMQVADVAYYQGDELKAQKYCDLSDAAIRKVRKTFWMRRLWFEWFGV